MVLRALNMSTQQCERKAAAKARLTKALNAAALAQVSCCGGSCCALCEVQNVLHKVCWAGCGQRELVMQHNMHHVLQQLALQQHADQCCGHRIERCAGCPAAAAVALQAELDDFEQKQQPAPEGDAAAAVAAAAGDADAADEQVSSTIGWLAQMAWQAPLERSLLLLPQFIFLQLYWSSTNLPSSGSVASTSYVCLTDIHCSSWCKPTLLQLCRLQQLILDRTSSLIKARLLTLWQSLSCNVCVPLLWTAAAGPSAACCCDAPAHHARRCHARHRRHQQRSSSWRAGRLPALRVCQVRTCSLIWLDVLLDGLEGHAGQPLMRAVCLHCRPLLFVDILWQYFVSCELQGLLAVKSYGGHQNHKHAVLPAAGC